MMFTDGFVRVADQLRKEIDNELNSIGLLCRVFGRGKTAGSFNRKVKDNPEKYKPNGRLIQDAVGVRVVLYFHEDVKIVEGLLKEKYVYNEGDSVVDRPASTEFSVSRYNLIFRLPDSYFRDIPEASAELPVDRTFEVQVRTILSEGWHEVEHDLRYKRKSDWVGHDDLSRGLNGVVATLETAEWSMRKIFDDLAYKHYKSGNWDAMLHSALRMRTTTPLSTKVSEFFDEDRTSAKKLARIDRAKLFSVLMHLAPRLPLTADNLVFVWNITVLKNQKLNELSPKFVFDTVNQSLG